MLLRFEIDSDFSSNYMKRQIDEIVSLLYALYEKKLKDDEEEEEVQYVKKSKSKIKKNNKKKVKKDDDEVDLLELIQEEIDEQESKENESKDYTIAVGSLAQDSKETKEIIKESDPKIICECGGSFIKRNKLRHETSKTHKQFVALKNISNK
jgi:predicted nucleic acid-binding protein